MSKKVLKSIADEVCAALEARGLGGRLTAQVRPEASGTDGWCAVLSAADANPGLDLWLDRYLQGSERELYYGALSARKKDLQKSTERLADVNEILEVSADDQVWQDGAELLMENLATRARQGFLRGKNGAGIHWFGRYAPASQAIDETTSFFEALLHLAAADDTTFREGVCHQVTTSRRERDPRARAACLSRHGYQCYICDFDFAVEYGETIGSKFIHVHHLDAMSKGPRETKAATDLIPVCPNCHAMLHRRTPPLTPDELRQHRNCRDATGLGRGRQPSAQPK